MENNALLLMPGEEIIKIYNKVTVYVLAFLSYQKMIFMDLTLTNKRVILSSDYLLVKPSRLPLSMFYNYSDLEKDNKMYGLGIVDVYKKNGFVCVKGKRKSFFTNLTLKIKDTDLIYDTAILYGVKSSKG